MDPEEIPVTFQIGMLGSDGVLLASDTCVTYGSHLEGSIRRTEPVRKIEIDRVKNFAFCWAGDDLGVLTAEAITATISEAAYGDFKAFLRICANTAVENSQALRRINPNRHFGACTFLIVAPTSGMVLWKLQVQNVPGQLTIMIDPKDLMGAKIFAGDQASVALFFTERYFPGDRKLRIEDLVPLAAHTVLMAGKFNDGVSGLQIVLCRPEGFQELSEEDIAGRLRWSAEVDSQIERLLEIPPI